VITTKLLIVTVDRNSDRRIVWRGCWKATGRTQRLATVKRTARDAPTALVDGFKASREWVAWGRSSLSDAGGCHMRSVNLKTGAAGVRVSVPCGAPLSAHEGPIPVLDPPSYVLARNGNVAWLASGRDEDGSDRDAIYTPDGTGGVVAIDEGPSHSLTSPTLRGLSCRWSHNGSQRDYVLPRP
jgi:hypothetical protein